MVSKECFTIFGLEKHPAPKKNEKKKKKEEQLVTFSESLQGLL